MKKILVTNEVNTSASSRLEGLDLARFIALIGMVIVNFNIVMGAQGEGWLQAVTDALAGRAAALFVVLAGIGLGLSSAKQVWRDNVNTITKRALFLLVLGLLNIIMFSGDILHYYAFYFLIGLFFLRAPVWVLSLSAIGFIIGFIMLSFAFDYDVGWDWDTYEYSGFWTIEGFVRNLFFNGWHPVFPWFGFLLFGLILARIPLQKRQVQLWLLLAGIIMVACGVMVADLALVWAYSIGDGFHYFFGIEPIIPGPLYMLVGTGTASAVIGLCLLFEAPLKHAGMLRLFTRPGRMTLTLYIAHIYIGMEALNMLELTQAQTLERVYAAAFVFCVSSIGFAWVWAKWFRHGPLEAVMRRVAG